MNLHDLQLPLGERTAPLSHEPAGVGMTISRLLRQQEHWQLADQPHAWIEVAVSCLVAPQEGDLVLATGQGETWFILAVLQRTDMQAPLHIDTGRRALQVKANDLSLDAGNNLSLQACHIESDSQRLVQKTAEHTLHAAGTSATHANSVAVQAERSLNLRSQLGIIQTSSLLKIDGAQVHFG